VTYGQRAFELLHDASITGLLCGPDSGESQVPGVPTPLNHGQTMARGACLSRSVRC